jgi:micrococcal nuclease
MILQRTRARIALVALVGAGLIAPAIVSTAGTADAAAPTQFGKVKYIDDGDTIDVDLAHDGTHKRARIRYIGIQAMELKHYDTDLSKIRGECWATSATKKLYQLVYNKRVRLTSRTGGSRPGRAGQRLRRYVEVKIDGKWQDTGSLMLKAGLVLPEPSHDEWGKNHGYQIFGQRAAAAKVGMWGDSSHCGVGPSQGAPLTVSVQYDAPGKDPDNLNGEWVAITNDNSSDVSLAGWWVRDTSNRGYQAHGYTFPSGAKVGAGQTLRLHVGSGTHDATNYYWGWTRPAFVNPTGSPEWLGDGGFLFDPDGDLRGWDMYPCFSGC